MFILVEGLAYYNAPNRIRFTISRERGVLVNRFDDSDNDIPAAILLFSGFVIEVIRTIY